MAADLTLGDLRVYAQDNGIVDIYYWVGDGKSVLGTLHVVEASLKDGQFTLGACKRRGGRQRATGEDYTIVLMPSEMHHAIYEHYPKLMTYLMLKGKRHG